MFESVFDVDLYIEHITPSDAVPSKFVSLLGLPELKRNADEPTRLGVKAIDIVIIDKLYICKNSVYQDRLVQWRYGMKNLFRISDNETDELSSFIGYDNDCKRYINHEHEYHLFKLLLIRVRIKMFFQNIIFLFSLQILIMVDRISMKHCALRIGLWMKNSNWSLSPYIFS
jgi:hypothetical protein